MNKFNLIMFSFMIGTNAFAYSGPNRITAPADPAARCANKAMPLEPCEARRLTALNRGCISQQEYDNLRRHGSFPLCNYEETNQDLMFDSWCSCGCFHPDTLISAFDLNSDQYTEAKAVDIVNKHKDFEVFHLTEEATVKSFAFNKTGLRSPTRGPEEHPLVVIETVNGKVLKLTDKHPVLLSEGRMVQAKELSERDRLLTSEGEVVAIQKIREEAFSGEVVNFMIDSDLDHKNEHIIIAEGLAVGDLAWQSSLEDELNKIVLRQ